MTDNLDHTRSFLSAFAGLDTVYDFRALHDRDRGRDGIAIRGRFADVAERLTALNSAGYGIHVMINETDGHGQRVPNVTQIRAQLVDNDDFDASQQLARLAVCPTPPHITVHTSPGKTQSWILCDVHTDKQLYTDNQRRLIAAYNGDPKFIDAAHTARLPGFYHSKALPSLVTFTHGPAWQGRRYNAWEVAAPLLHISVMGANADTRQPLGYAPWAAPSLEWLQYALWKIDPNSIGRDGWIAITAAFKQSGWSFGEVTIRALWDAWCGWYERNDAGENSKQWNDITATSAGWSALVRRANIGGELMAAGLQGTYGVSTQSVQAVNGARQGDGANADVAQLPDIALATSGPFLTPYEQATYFAGCTSIVEAGKILGPNGRMMDTNRFNLRYGGKMFMLDNDGTRTTDEPWKAATRGQAFRIPVADHLRFLPSQPFGALVHDEFREVGVNKYRIPQPVAVPGDVSPFLRHVERVLPVERDRSILYAFMAQCVQRPGVKVKWGVLIQSMEGAGKTLFISVMEAAVGRSYVHVPAAKELTEGGGKFNGWMRDKLMIIINEIKTDEKRELVEVMKPWITDYRVEMQPKGQDQFVYDNPTNWLMFTNYKDAIPINSNSRRYCILYSAIQDQRDLDRLGMDGQYFSDLYRWADDQGGAAAVVDWLLHYPIPADLDAQQQCTRAPRTSSTDEALAVSRSWLEQLIVDAVEGSRQGFRNGWIGSAAVNALIKANGHKLPGPNVVPKALANLGYGLIGRATTIFMQEGEPYQSRLYNLNVGADIKLYGRDQGYEP